MLPLVDVRLTLAVPAPAVMLDGRIRLLLLPPPLVLTVRLIVPPAPVLVTSPATIMSPALVMATVPLLALLVTPVTHSGVDALFSTILPLAVTLGVKLPVELRALKLPTVFAPPSVWPALDCVVNTPLVPTRPNDNPPSVMA